MAKALTRKLDDYSNNNFDEG